MPRLTATFITMFKEPISAYMNTPHMVRAQKKNLLSINIQSILESTSFNHHMVDDTPYGGGAGELIKISVIAPLIKRALCRQNSIEREKKRVLLMDPAGKPFKQKEAKRLACFEELIFVCGRYQGIDARVYHYVDEALSLGDFVLSSGDIAALAIFEATARMIDGFLGNELSKALESHENGRLESSNYTRPREYENFFVPSVLEKGNHCEISKAKTLESLLKTMELRPDLIKDFPLSEQERNFLLGFEHNTFSFPWKKPE